MATRLRSWPPALDMHSTISLPTAADEPCDAGVDSVWLDGDADVGNGVADDSRTVSLSSMALSRAPSLRNRSITSLDLSRNNISNLDGLGATALPLLTTLNLFFNNVSMSSEVLKLADHAHLRSLNLQLNPVTRMTDYRSIVVYHLASLTTLDGAAVTAADRQAAQAHLLDRRLFPHTTATTAPAVPTAAPGAIWSTAASATPATPPRVSRSRHAGGGGGAAGCGDLRHAAAEMDILARLRQATRGGRTQPPVSPQPPPAASTVPVAASMPAPHSAPSSPARAGAFAPPLAGVVDSLTRQLADAAAHNRELQQENQWLADRVAVLTAEGAASRRRPASPPRPAVAHAATQTPPMRRSSPPRASPSRAVACPTPPAPPTSAQGGGGGGGDSGGVMSRAYNHVLALLRETHSVLMATNQRLTEQLAESETNFATLRGRYLEVLDELERVKGNGL